MSDMLGRYFTLILGAAGSTAILLNSAAIGGLASLFGLAFLLFICAGIWPEASR